VIEKSLNEVILQAIEEGITVAELEPLGIEERICNILNNHNVFTLEQLLRMTDIELLKIKNIGLTCIEKIKKAIRRLPEFEELRKAYIDKIMPGKL
jgi:DNA-directed RNA polymerase alpha subunit